MAVQVSGLRYAPALDWDSQGDIVVHIKSQSVLFIYHMAKSGLKVREYIGVQGHA